MKWHNYYLSWQHNSTKSHVRQCSRTMKPSGYCWKEHPTKIWTLQMYGSGLESCWIITLKHCSFLPSACNQRILGGLVNVLAASSLSQTSTHSSHKILSKTLNTEIQIQTEVIKTITRCDEKTNATTGNKICELALLHLFHFLSVSCINYFTEVVWRKNKNWSRHTYSLVSV